MLVAGLSVEPFERLPVQKQGACHQHQATIFEDLFMIVETSERRLAGSPARTMRREEGCGRGNHGGRSSLPLLNLHHSCLD